MVKINLLLTNYETLIEIDLENSSDLNNFITTKLGIENYILKLEDGSKRNSKNILLIDDLLKNKIDVLDPLKERINIIIEFNNKLKNFDSQILRNLQAKKYVRNSKEDLENFINLLNTYKIKSEFTEKIYQKTLNYIESHYQIQNQKLIYDFYFNYYKIKISKIISNLEKKAVFLKNMKNFDCDLKENFYTKYLKELRNLKFGEFSILELLENAKLLNIELIEPKYKEFAKSMQTFENKINFFNEKFKDIEGNVNLKLNKNKAVSLSYDLEDFIKTQCEYFVNEFKKIIDENNNPNNSNNYLSNNYNPKNLFKDLLASFENFWKNLYSNSLLEQLSKLDKIKEENHQKLMSLLEDDFEKKIKDLNIKFSEIQLLKKNIHHNYEFLNLPIILSKHYPLMEKEIHRRKKIDYVFNNILLLLKEKFIEKEEEYIKRFNCEIEQVSKNSVCKFLFRKLSENYSLENLASDKNLSFSVTEITNTFDKIIDNIFDLNKEKEILSNKKIIDINSPDFNTNIAEKNYAYEDINDSKIYEKFDLNSNNKTKNINETNSKSNFENINEISFNNPNKLVDINMNSNSKNNKGKNNLNQNPNKNSNNNSLFSPQTPTLNNLSISNNNINNTNFNNYNQNAIFEEYENILNNFNERVLSIQKDLNSLLINVHKYSEKDLFQIDSNQKFCLKNSSNNLFITNNDTFINLNLDHKNSENNFDDSLFLTNKDFRKKNLDDTNLIHKNNLSCNNIITSFPNSNLIYNIENIFTNIQKIKAYIKLINMSSNKKNNVEENKEDDLDFSMNSLINSIYISKVVQHQTTKINEFDEHFKNENNYPLLNSSKLQNYNITENTDLAAFLNLHVHKIYFYDDIFNMLQNFIEKKKIKYELNKENCDSIGTFLEMLIKKYIKISNDYPKLVRKIMETNRKK